MKVRIIAGVVLVLVGFRLIGLKGFVVLSGSMEPTYHTGSVIYVKSADADALEAGEFLKGCIAAMIPLGVTGGIHMDGLMDTADAMASWQEKERRLEILKDSHVGAFAVIACAAYLLCSAGLFSQASWKQAVELTAIFVLSRALSAWTLTHFKSARPGGMLDSFAKTAQKKMVAVSGGIYLVLCALVWCLGAGWAGAACLPAAALCVALYRRRAYRYFGGVTGDLAGWFVQMTEIVLTAVIILGGKIG